MRGYDEVDSIKKDREVLGYPGGDVSATKNAKIAKGGSRLSRPPKPHGTHYALFKTELLYRHKNAPQKEADAVVVRLTDFARSPKVKTHSAISISA